MLINCTGFDDPATALRNHHRQIAQRLARANEIDTSEWKSRLSFEWRNAVAWIERRDATGQPDSKTDSDQLSGEKFPENPEVSRLAAFIRKKDAAGETKKSLALQFTDGNEKKAESLLRQLSPSRFGHLLNGTRFEPVAKT